MPDSLHIALKNDSDSSDIHAYVTGLALQKNNERVLVKADGKGLYYPTSPSEILQPLQEDVAIPLGPPGNTVHVNIPQIAGGRLWFSRGAKLTFLLNPGPQVALVEPSVLNPSDANATVDFAFCEFTLNANQLFANISYVDFVGALPISLTLQTANSGTQTVSGMPVDGIDRVAKKMRAQASKDGHPWDKLIVQHQGRNLRILAPTHGNAVQASFDSFFEPYIDEVWSHYHPSHGARCLRINTQAGPGVVDGAIDPNCDEIDIAGERFSKPTSADVLGCNSGPFATGASAARNAIIPRLAAAFARSTLLETDEHPSGPETFYRHERTNHYARVVHEVNVDGKGYAFAYDDVQPDGGADQSGKVEAGDPVLWTVSVGGKSAGAVAEGAGAAPDQEQQQQQQQRSQPVQGGGGHAEPTPPVDEGRHGKFGKLKGMAEKFFNK